MHVALVVRHVVVALAVDLVGHAHLHRVERVEEVELGQGELGEAVQSDGLAHHHGVEPSDAAPATCVGAVLAAALDEVVGQSVGHLGRERTRADPVM